VAAGGKKGGRDGKSGRQDGSNHSRVHSLAAFKIFIRSAGVAFVIQRNLLHTLRRHCLLTYSYEIAWLPLAKSFCPAQSSTALYWYVFELYAGHAVNRDLDSELGRLGPRPPILHRNAPVCMAIAALGRIFYELSGSWLLWFVSPWVHGAFGKCVLTCVCFQSQNSFN